MPRNITFRQLIHDLAKAGFAPVRTRGSHQTWRHAEGAQVTVVIGAVSRHVRAEVARAIARVGGRS